MAYNCRNERNIEKNRRADVGGPEYQSLSNKFKVLASRIIQVEISNKRKRKEKLFERSDNK